MTYGTEPECAIPTTPQSLNVYTVVAAMYYYAQYTFHYVGLLSTMPRPRMGSQLRRSKSQQANIQRLNVCLL